MQVRHSDELHIQVIFQDHFKMCSSPLLPSSFMQIHNMCILMIYAEIIEMDNSTPQECAGTNLIYLTDQVCGNKTVPKFAPSMQQLNVVTVLTKIIKC